MTTASGPSFISLQVRDLDAAGAFYEKYLGLTRQPGPPHAIVFGTTPAAFAVRSAAPGVDLDSVTQLGLGVGIWMHAADTQGIHDTLAADGIIITSTPLMARSVAPSRSPTSTATRSRSTTAPREKGCVGNIEHRLPLPTDLPTPRN